MEPAYVVAMFDIDRYVYVFFRELAVESTAFCDKTYYSRVARVCKVRRRFSRVKLQAAFHWTRKPVTTTFTVEFCVTHLLGSGKYDSETRTISTTASSDF